MRITGADSGPRQDAQHAALQQNGRTHGPQVGQGSGRQGRGRHVSQQGGIGQLHANPTGHGKEYGNAELDCVKSVAPGIRVVVGGGRGAVGGGSVRRNGAFLEEGIRLCGCGCRFGGCGGISHVVCLWSIVYAMQKRKEVNGMVVPVVNPATDLLFGQVKKFFVVVHSTPSWCVDTFSNYTKV